MNTILAPIENLIGFLMTRIYDVVPNVGLSIIIVTMFVMLLVFPLTHKQTKSMLKMQAIQPQVKELQKKYKDDRQKLSEETMALYKEAGVNPLGGCLPLLIQSPFFFAIFRVVKDIEKFAQKDSKLFRSLCAPARTLKECKLNAQGLIDAKLANANNAQDLADHLPKGARFLGLHLDESLIKVSDQGFGTILPYIGLILLISIAAYISISRSQSLNPNAPSQMKFLKYLMPIAVSISPIILPAGPNLYIFTSSVWRAAQQEFLYRKIILPHHSKVEKAKEVEKDTSENASNDPVDESYTPGLARKKRKKK